MIDKFLYITVLILLVFFRPTKLEEFSEILNLNYSIVYILLLIVFFTRQRLATKNWLRFDVIFLIGFTIAHFQVPFLASLGILPERPFFIWPNQKVVNFATWMSLFSITLWMLGYSIFNYPFRPVEHKWASLNTSFLLYDIVLLIVFIIFLVTVGPSLFKGEYAGSSIWGEGAVYPFLILRTMLNLRIIYFIAAFGSKFNTRNILNKFKRNKLFFLVLFIYVLLFLLSGKRGSIMQVALVAAGAYTIFIKRISLVKLVTLLCAGAFLFTLLSLGRGVGDQVTEVGNIFTRGYSAYKEEDNINLTEDLSSTVRIQYRALDTVPDEHPYLYGLTFVTRITSIIPLSSGLVVNIFEIPKIYQGSSNFFTIIERGQNPSSGDGSEVLGDIYINFGIYGVFIAMFFFGLLSKYVYDRALLKNELFVLIYLILLYSALSMNRGSLLIPLQDIAYIMFLHLLFTKLNNKKHVIYSI